MYSTGTAFLIGLLYLGDLKQNLLMYPGDYLYVPSTLMAKIIRMVSPVSTTIGLASSSPSEVGSVKAGMSALAK